MRLAELVGKPTIIVKQGEYVTRCGEHVMVVSIDRGWASGHYADGTIERWDISGRLLPFTESRNDIVSLA